MSVPIGRPSSRSANVFPAKIKGTTINSRWAQTGPIVSGAPASPAVQVCLSQAEHAHRPLHPRLVGMGAVLLAAAFVTDLAYARSLLFQWENFSMWLLMAGLVLAAIAGLALILDVASHRIERIDWLRFCGFATAALVSLLNSFVHSRDAYTAVVPDGLILSTTVTAILVIVGWRGWNVGVPVTSNTLESEDIR